MKFVFLILVSLAFVSCASNRQPASVDPMDVKEGNNTDYYDATIYGGR